jgi:hypothetical protein
MKLLCLCRQYEVITVMTTRAHEQVLKEHPAGLSVKQSGSTSKVCTRGYADLEEFDLLFEIQTIVFTALELPLAEVALVVVRQ